MAYNLFIQGREHPLSDLSGVARALRRSLGTTSVDFTVQYFNIQGDFSFAFGGEAKLGSELEIKYNRWTTNSTGAKNDMKTLETYLALTLRLE